MRVAVPMSQFAVALALVALSSTVATAQQRHAVAVARPASTRQYGIARAAVAVPNEDTWRTRDCWKWVGIGALIGAAAAEGLVALEVARNHSDDGMILPIVPLVAIGIAGGVGGGLGGALAYASAHPAPAQSP